MHLHQQSQRASPVEVSTERLGVVGKDVPYTNDPNPRYGRIHGKDLRGLVLAGIVPCPSLGYYGNSSDFAPGKRTSFFSSA